MIERIKQIGASVIRPMPSALETQRREAPGESLSLEFSRTVVPNKSRISSLREEEQERLSRVLKEFESRTSRTYVSKGNGIGDMVIALRVCLAAARATPQTHITILARPAIAEIPYIDLASNMTLVPRENLDDPLAQDEYWDMTIFSGGLSVRSSRENFFFTGTNSEQDWQRPIRKYNRQDVLAHGDFREMDLPVSPADMNRSILSATELPNRPVRDVLLIPEAKEVVSDRDDRSVKSIDAVRWRETFEIMRKQGFVGRLGIVGGHTYPDYVVKVLEAGIASGLDVHDVQTDNLARLCEEVAQSGMVVGMDTGPMHLAGEVVKAVARDQGRIINFRQIFNGVLFGLPMFRITFDERQRIPAHVLEYKDSHKDSHKDEYGSLDISNLPPDEVARFILS